MEKRVFFIALKVVSTRRTRQNNFWILGQFWPKKGFLAQPDPKWSIEVLRPQFSCSPANFRPSSEFSAKNIFPVGRSNLRGVTGRVVPALAPAPKKAQKCQKWLKNAKKRQKTP